MHHTQRPTETLAQKANMAMEEAALAAVEEAKRHHTPMVIWEDNQIKHIPADVMEERLKSRGIAQQRPK